MISDCLDESWTLVWRAALVSNASWLVVAWSCASCCSSVGALGTHPVLVGMEGVDGEGDVATRHFFVLSSRGRFLLVLEQRRRFR